MDDAWYGVCPKSAWKSIVTSQNGMFMGMKWIGHTWRRS